jgi:AraC-like DNA-binding protein
VQKVRGCHKNRIGFHPVEHLLAVAKNRSAKSIGKFFGEPGVACYIGALSLELGRLHSHRTVFEPELAAHPASLRAKEFMDGRPGESWKLEELAGLCGVSVPHLIAVFRKDFFSTPRQYLLLRRLERAAQMLRSSNRSITEVALESGFSSSQHFAHAFRKQFGRTPSTEPWGPENSSLIKQQGAKARQRLSSRD